MKTREFSFSLPEELIAQTPPENRGDSRLLILDKSDGSIRHDKITSLPGLLPPDSLVVLNNSKVRKARIFGKSENGGRIELLMIERTGPVLWKTMMSKAKKQKSGKRIVLDGGASGIITGAEGMYRIVEFDSPVDDAYLDQHGHVPLPPYIKREDVQMDAERYQTVYADEIGSAAAPTAGLHLTGKALDEIGKRGIEIVQVTLHVGLGTFLPVRTDEVEDHKMHEECFSISASAAETITKAKQSGKMVIAVGTTSVRTLESAWDGQRIIAGDGATRLFIYPGYRFQVVDTLLTNFHTPESSLLMLVSAFGGTDNIRNAYREAVEKRYRFFSYGDAMLIQ